MIGKCAIYFKTSSSTGWMMAGSVTSIELIIWNFWMILRILNGPFITRWQHLLVLFNLQILWLCSVRMVTMNFIRSANIVMSVASMRKIVQILIICTVSWWVSCLFHVFLHWSIFFCHRETLVKKHWFSEDEWTVFLLSFYYILVLLERNFGEIAMIITVTAFTLRLECVDTFYNLK